MSLDLAVAELELRRRRKERESAGLYDWLGPNGKARDKQRPPGWEWFVWLILAGRGFGKTRTGAEWVRWKVETKQCKRLALVAPTAADARDVMVEGESGILAISPPDSRPVYEPSKRRITWPSGAIATLYSADEPDRLRGPQHDGAWCLVGETSVAMADGTAKRIDSIRPGDIVQTRIGPKPVISAMMTKRNAELFRLSLVDGQDIIGTYDHPVWIEGQGFVPLGRVVPGSSACVISASSTPERCGISPPAATTRRRSGCIGSSGSRPTGRSRRTTTSTIGTGTRRTTALRTWNSSATASTAPATMLRSCCRIAKGPSPRPVPLASGWRTSVPSGCWFASTAAASIRAGRSTPGDSARQPAPTPQGPSFLIPSSDSAPIAASPTWQPDRPSITAPSDATIGRRATGSVRLNCGPSDARRAAANSRASGATPGSVAANAPCVTTRTIASVEKLARRSDVYDIAVEDAREFFANGILVHNCDEIAAWRYPDAWDQLLFGLRLGDRPQICATTTPRPIPLVKSLLKDKKVAVTRGSTYENSANLAATTLEELRNKYEGTRLGRQELNAEVLEDVEGALWSIDMLDRNRVAAGPQMARVAVAIDPSGGDGEGNDEQGIVACGKGEDGLGYVLGDYSVKETPNGWARAAINAYLATEADFIVYEANYGGAMVLSTLQAAADAMAREGLPTRDIRFKKVTAMRGKQLRAEPVVALYEQGRVKHVGSLPGLEQQMTTWVPDIGSSPDRVDAMVWAITALDIRNAGRFRFGSDEPAPDPARAEAGWDQIDNPAFWGDAE